MGTWVVQGEGQPILQGVVPLESSLKLEDGQAMNWVNNTMLCVLGNPIGVSAEISLIFRIAF